MAAYESEGLVIVTRKIGQFGDDLESYLDVLNRHLQANATHLTSCLLTIRISVLWL